MDQLLTTHKPTVRFIPASLTHAKIIAQHMRQSDRDEIMAMSGLTPIDGLVSSILWSTRAWTALLNETPVFMCGVAASHIKDEVGQPWLLATTHAECHARYFVPLQDFYVAEMLAAHPRLANHVSAQNTTSIRWLKALGFEIGTPRPWGVAGELFHPFEMRRAA